MWCGFHSLTPRSPFARAALLSMLVALAGCAVFMNGAKFRSDEVGIVSQRGPVRYVSDRHKVEGSPRTKDVTAVRDLVDEFARDCLAAFGIPVADSTQASDWTLEVRTKTVFEDPAERVSVSMVDGKTSRSTYVGYRKVGIDGDIYLGMGDKKPMKRRFFTGTFDVYGYDTQFPITPFSSLYAEGNYKFSWELFHILASAFDGRTARELMTYRSALSDGDAIDPRDQRIRDVARDYVKLYYED